MKHLILALVFFMSHFANGSTVYVERQNDPYPGFFKNASFENGISNWVTGTGTPSFPTAIGSKITGTRGFKLAFTGAAANTTLLQQTYANCADLDGLDMVTGIHIKTPSTTIEVCSQVDGVDYQCNGVPSGGTKLSFVKATFIAQPLTCGMRVKTNALTTGDITVDAARLIEDRSVGVNDKLPTTSYTPTVTHASGTMTNYTIRTQYSVESNIVRVRGDITFTGSPGTWSGINISYPPNFPRDNTTPVGAFTSTNEYAGYVIYNDVGVNAYTGATLLTNAGYFQLRIDADITNTGTSYLGTGGNPVQNVPFTWVSGDQITFDTEYRTTTPVGGNVVQVPGANILGTVFIEPNSATCRIGSVKLDGSTLSGSQYAELIAYNGTAVLKNWSALSPRGTGTQAVNTRTKTGPALGVVMEDQMQSHIHDQAAHKHNLWGLNGGGGGSLHGLAVSGVGAVTDLFPVTGQVQANGAMDTADPAIGAPVVDGANGTPRIGTETRGNSIGVTWCQWYVSQASQLIKQSVIYSDTVKSEGVTGVTTISDGSYTPTLTNIGNATSLTVTAPLSWSRQGKYVRVWGAINFGCTTAAGTQTDVNLTLPVASTFTLNSDVSGSSGAGFSNEAGAIYADTANNRARLRVHCQVTTAGQNRFLNFNYEIK